MKKKNFYLTLFICMIVDTTMILFDQAHCKLIDEVKIINKYINLGR